MAKHTTNVFFFFLKTYQIEINVIPMALVVNPIKTLVHVYHKTVRQYNTLGKMTY